MSAASSPVAFIITAIDADGRRHSVPAVTLELALPNGSGRVLVDCHPHAVFADQLILRAEPRAELQESHFCAFTLRPGACNVLHVGLETLPAVEPDTTWDE